jgi:molybdopterin-guanine dinucleotide biosynthesis protein A
LANLCAFAVKKPLLPLLPFPPAPYLRRMHAALPLFGLVLAAGKSRRMGFDKSLIAYHGKPQREHLFELLQTVCERVYLSCRRDQEVSSAMNPLPDALDIDSPLNGILTAFQHHPESAWLAVAVDLPNVSQDILRELELRRDPTRLATCFFDRRAQAPEPLLTIWEPAAQPLLLANAAAGNISPRFFLQAHNVNIVHGMDDTVFLNVNDPVARKRWQQLGYGKDASTPD